MISSQSVKPLEEIPSSQPSQKYTQVFRRRIGLHSLGIVCVLLACLGAAIFSYQLFIVPQPASFAPQWGNAQWVRATDGQGPVAYFRHSFDLNAPPNSAFVVVAANQIYTLYVNGVSIGTNRSDFIKGNFPKASVYDITSILSIGANVVALRVANVDNVAPTVRASVGLVRGGAVYRDGSGDGWVATANESLVYPRYAYLPITTWNNPTFDASAWRSVQKDASLTLSPTTSVNPLLYERSSSQWISIGVSPDAYFVRQFSLPFSYNSAWLRLAATGTADVYINGKQFISWNGQPAIVTQDLTTYLSDDGTVVPPRTGLATGIYNISPYLHPGVNSIGIHVTSPGASSAQTGLTSSSAAVSADVLLSDTSGQGSWLSSDTHWRVSDHPVDNWTQAGVAVKLWSPPVLIARPGAISSFYLPEALTQQSVQIVPVPFLLEVVLSAACLVMSFWLLFSLGLLRRFYSSTGNALAAGSLMYLPALACEALLLVLAREPQMPQPFPFTWTWATLLAAIVWGTSLLLLLNARLRYKQLEGMKEHIVGTDLSRPASVSTVEKDAINRSLQTLHSNKLLLWLRHNWGVVVLVLLAIPLSYYHLSYEPYWQDELSSYYAAHGILTQGLPYFPSEFLYPKSELYSYLLALWTTLFGQADGVPRVISVMEYLITIPLIYIVGAAFFDKRVGFLAASMLTFSPNALIWARQMRMYEQEQLLLLVTVFLFYRAIQKREKVYLVYVAAASLILTYLSHEEVFIALPGLLCAILLASRDRKRPLPSVMYQKHWWFAGLLCVSLIGMQLLIAKYSHPPALGTDSSQRPQVGFTTDNIPFYTNLLFLPDNFGHNKFPWMTLNSVLATIGCFLARRNTDMRAKYCATFLMISIFMLVLVFTATADRYLYALLPMYYIMGSYALLTIALAFWSFVRPHIIVQKQTDMGKPVVGGYLSWPMHLILQATITLFCLSVLVAPIFPLSSYNPLVSKVVGVAYHRHYADYDDVGKYMKTRLEKQDIVISIAPPNCTLFYVGRVDYFFSVNRALFLLENNGTIIETASNAKAMFNQEDFQTVLESHSRIWIVSDNSAYQAEIFKRFTFPPDFHKVFEGYGSAVFFRGVS